MNTITRRFGSVTSKLQVRREAFIKSKYPEYAGSEVSTPADSGRRGRRLGGLFQDSSKSPLKLDGTESFYGEDRAAIDAEFVDKLKKASGNPDKLNSVMSQYREALDLMESTRDPISHERSKKIKDVTSIDFQTEQKRERPLKLPAVKARDSVTQFPIVREEQELHHSLPRIRSSQATGFWEKMGAKKFVNISSTSVPAVISSSLAEYKAATTASAMFDESFRYGIEITGEDCVFVMDHFATAPVANLNIGDSVFTAILDSKGYVISTGLISRMGDQSFELLLDEFKESVFRYLAQYTVYSRQSGMDVALRPSETTVVSLIGPHSIEALKNSISQENSPIKVFLGHEGEELPSLDYLTHLPPMSTITADTGMTIRKLPDSFLLSLPEESIDSILHSLAEKAMPAGVYALDMLRMEKGLPRPEIDVPSATSSPVKASLTWLVDQRKVRETVLFGHERISRELQRGVTHKRVGIVANTYVYAGCKIMSAPHRYVVGEITSCAWSPALGKRVCQAYVKPEYAAEGNPLLVNRPMAVPDSLNFRFKRRIVKQGAMQNVFRKLVEARVVTFPLVDRV